MAILDYTEGAQDFTNIFVCLVVVVIVLHGILLALTISLLLSFCFTKGATKKRRRWRLNLKRMTTRQRKEGTTTSGKGSLSSTMYGLFIM